jgi:cAMP-dependent protein kinase regulator
MSDSEDSDSDSEESIDEDDKPVSSPKPPVASRNSRRRASICAEKICPDKVGLEEIKKIPKTEEELSKIRDILLKCVLFEHLCDEQLLAVKEAMFPVSKEEDEVIIKRGDDGDNFYIIESGSVDVYIDQSTEECSNLVNSYSDGDSFGELAIMYNSPRAATCIARRGPVKLWALDRASFKVILMKAAISKRNLYKTFLREVPILSELTDREILTIADSLHEDNFDDGSIVFEEGTCGDRFYIIKEGSVVCKKLVGDGSSKEVACLKKGSYFGEVSLPF